MSGTRGPNYRLPAFLLILMNIFGFGLLFVANNYEKKILFIGAGVLGLYIVMYLIVILCKMGDKFIIPMASMLITIGIILLCRINISLGIKQIVWVALGGVAFFGAYFVYYKVRIWSKLWLLYAAIGTALFLITLIFGKTVNGSKNWISIGGQSFQPSEITKIMFILFLACYFSKEQTRPVFNIPPKWTTLIVTYIFIGFLVLQRDWGTILVLFSIYIFMIYVYEEGVKFLFLNIGVALVVAILGYMFLHHIQVRVNTWLDPWSDISNTGYQITQSLFAIASGGNFGKGIGNGSPGFIPEVHSDFIFSAICEEMGIFGGVAVIILFFLIAYRCFKISIMTTNNYDKAVCYGLTVMFAMQTFIIIGGVTKMIPLTGITLPFISYGGTSLVVSFASLGIIQAISAKTERGKNEELPVKKGRKKRERE